MNWYCINTKVNSEKKAAARLGSRNIETLSPRVIVVRPNGFNGWNEIERPLFPGYLFAKCTMEQYQLAASGTRKEILRMVRCADAPQVVDEFIIDEIRSRIDEYGYVQLAGKQARRASGYSYQPNDSVLVSYGGTFIEGLFVREEKQRIVVLMTMLNALREIPVDACYVRPAYV
jgi:transcription antitermination factor NusG